MHSLICKKRKFMGYDRYDVIISGNDFFVLHYSPLKDKYMLGCCHGHDKWFLKSIDEVCKISPELGKLFIRNIDKICFDSDSGCILISPEDFKKYFVKQMIIDE